MALCKSSKEKGKIEDRISSLSSLQHPSTALNSGEHTGKKT
jgi:hypothetical protein